MLADVKEQLIDIESWVVIVAGDCSMGARIIPGVSRVLERVRKDQAIRQAGTPAARLWDGAVEISQQFTSDCNNAIGPQVHFLFIEADPAETN